MCCVFFFFFKQKTAYEMRISDWSSDVCSSDLGPGDPEPCDYAIAATRVFLKRKLPTFGICLGHQIMGLAIGGKTIKMKTGHHGANHPVQDQIGRASCRERVCQYV